MKAMPFLWSSSGSLGFSEAWPHPAHTACEDQETAGFKVNAAAISYCGKTTDIRSVWAYLNGYPFSNIQNELNIGIVVIISPSWHRHVMICHFDVLCKKGRTTDFFLGEVFFLTCSASKLIHQRRCSCPLGRGFTRSETSLLKAHLHWPLGPPGSPSQQSGLPFRCETSHRPIGGWSACIWLLRCHCWRWAPWEGK